MIKQTVFVITYGRSGSTLLQNMINALPGHLLRGENNNILMHMIRGWQELRTSEQRARMIERSPAPSGPHQPWFGYEAIDPDSLGQELADVFIRQVIRPTDDITVAGFKEIRWHLEPDLFTPTLEFLQRHMPTARFVFNTRNHGEVCQSGWWKTLPEAEVRYELEGAEALYRGWQLDHPECSLAMHYNDYVKSPDAWRPLFAFIGVPFDEDLVKKVLGRKLVHMK